MRCPAELFTGASVVDRIAAIVAGPVFDEADERLLAAKGREDRLHDREAATSPRQWSSTWSESRGGAVGLLDDLDDAVLDDRGDTEALRVVHLLQQQLSTRRVIPKVGDRGRDRILEYVVPEEDDDRLAGRMVLREPGASAIPPSPS